ncbi:MAG: hypothetical protein ACFFEJ_11195 [Candidatus Thorarchaeota archaeon]
MESALKAALREILYASLSLDDGLSTIQNLAIANEKDSTLYFHVARAIEEIILRRPGLASAKLTELSVRLSFDKDDALRKMLMLLDARYNTVHVIAECELIPDLEALPRLLDVHGELIQAMIDAIELNLRPLLPFLTDEVLATLDGIYTRGHDASTKMAIYEAHYLTTKLSEAGAFDCSEAILNRLMTMARDEGLDDLAFDITLDEASVLTEIGLYKESRDTLQKLRDDPEIIKDPIKLAACTLQLAINETRDDSIPFEVARAFADEAAQRFEMILDCEDCSKDGLGLAHLVIGSNILANGWREAVPEGIKRLEAALSIFENIENPDHTQTHLLFKCLTGLGFAYGLMRGHGNVSTSLDYLDRAQNLLNNLSDSQDHEQDIARSYNAIGWICLSSDSDEYWELGIESFEKAIEMRETLLKKGNARELEVLSSKVGRALSLLRTPGPSRPAALEELQGVLSQYVPLFPTDSRSFIEIAIATYNLVWLSIRHGIELSPRMSRLLEDVDRMLIDARSQEDSIFIHGASLVVPYLTGSWKALEKRSANLLKENSQLDDTSKLVNALATAKRNLEAISLEVVSSISEDFDEDLIRIDPLLAQYWKGQAALANTIRSYYENKDFSSLATGLYKSAHALGLIEEVDTDYGESAEFIRATALSLSKSLMKFALVLEDQYSAYIDRSEIKESKIASDNEQYSFLLAEDWLGLLKISDSYLHLVEDSELVEAQPYLNAVFSNTTRALRMMDTVSMIERRVFSHLGNMMNKRYYLRR